MSAPIFTTRIAGISLTNVDPMNVSSDLVARLIRRREKTWLLRIITILVPVTVMLLFVFPLAAAELETPKDTTEQMADVAAHDQKAPTPWRAKIHLSLTDESELTGVVVGEYLLKLKTAFGELRISLVAVIHAERLDARGQVFEIEIQDGKLKGEVVPESAALTVRLGSATLKLPWDDVQTVARHVKSFTPTRTLADRDGPREDDMGFCMTQDGLEGYFHILLSSSC